MKEAFSPTLLITGELSCWSSAAVVTRAVDRQTDGGQSNITCKHQTCWWGPIITPQFNNILQSCHWDGAASLTGLWLAENTHLSTRSTEPPWEACWLSSDEPQEKWGRIRTSCLIRQSLLLTTPISHCCTLIRPWWWLTAGLWFPAESETSTWAKPLQS